MSDLREKLAEALDEAEWSLLEPHAERGACVLVNPGLTLLDAAEAIARDEAATVQRWLTEGLLAKPSPARLEEWKTTPGKAFGFIIVQPFVLIQEKVGA